MQLTLGDLVIIEFALAHYLKGMDISMFAGQQCASIIGKVEYQIAAIQTAATQSNTDPTIPKAN